MAKRNNANFLFGQIENFRNLFQGHGCRIFNTVWSGTRVPFRTHASLAFPGTLSTAGHWDQSSCAIANPSIIERQC
jgi:hypothetical protein